MLPSLHYAVAVPNDPRIDDFDSGNEEVDHYFKGRKWFTLKKGVSPPTYQFLTEEGGDVVGYAAAAFTPCAHPTDQSVHKAKVLLIYAIGANRCFQGKQNPRAPHETFAASMIGILEAYALNKEECAGLQLWVRTDNSRAIVFYERIGFKADPNGPIRRDEKAPHLTMRKPVLSRKSGF